MAVELSTDAMPLPQGMQAGRSEKLPSRASTPKIVDASHGEPAARGTVVRAHVELGRMLAANERLSSQAVSTRDEDRTLNEVDELVGRMRDEVETIQKSYPPYPPGSEERVRILKSYAGLRHQIAQLTVPPETDGRAATDTSKRSADPATKYTFLLSLNGAVRTVSRGDVRVGPTGLTIPELQEAAGDDEVAEAGARLDSTSEAISKERTRNAEAALADADAEIDRGKATALGVTTGKGRTQETTAYQWAVTARAALAEGTTGILHTSELRDFMSGL
jgi:hypothetical protein